MKNIELETPIDEMSEADLRETFAQVMEAHDENLETYNTLQTDLDEASDYEERVEELEAEKEEAVSYFAAKASEITNISEEILQTRFSVEELVEMAGKADEAAAEFSEQEAETEEAEATEAEESEEEASVFAEKEQKSPAFSSDDVDARKEAAKERLSRIGGVSF